ncbi:MAG: GNAT family N-acetyltransferase [Chloroflexota bacterium]
MNENVAIRLMGPADIPSVTALFDELDAYHRQELPWLFRSPESEPRDESFYHQIFNNGHENIFVAETEQVVGIIQLTQRSTPSLPIFVPQTRLLVDTLYVAEPFRRRGIARALMQKAEGWAHEIGAIGLDLSVYEFNKPARLFFESMGYVTLNRGLSKPL